MNRKLIATSTISLQASAAAVWDALTNPDVVRQYLRGTDMQTTWALGSPITFTGEWDGRPYVDKGVILEYHPFKVLSYSYWSSFSGKEDFEDNYAHITFHLSEFDEEVILIITQDNFDTDEEVVKAEGNWMEGQRKIKEIVEGNNSSTKPFI